MRFLTIAATAVAAVLLAAGGAGARSQTNWIEIHVHLNAYAHWGHCSGPGGLAHAGAYDGTCTGDRGAEIGVLAGREHFLSHGSRCKWRWIAHTLTVEGTDVRGGQWQLKGVKDHDWTYFEVHAGHIHGHPVWTGGGRSRGEPSGPLSVDMSQHKFWNGVTAEWGYSIDLRGYVAVG